jgi:integrase
MSSWRRDNPQHLDKAANAQFLENSVKPATLSRYEGFIKEKFLALSLTLPADVEALTTFARKLRDDGLLADTVRSYVGAIKSLSEIKYGSYFSPQETAKLKRLYDAIDNACSKRPPQQASVLTASELRRVACLNTAPGSEWENMRFFVVLTTALSLRPCELLRLRAGDLSRANTTVFGMDVSLRCTKTGKSMQKVTQCIHGTMSEITCYGVQGQALCPAHALWSRKKDAASPDDCVFMGGRLNDRLKRFTLEMNLSTNLTSYTGRRTGTQMLLNKGVGEEEIQAGVGWMSAGMVATYGREVLQARSALHAKKILSDE